MALLPLMERGKQSACHAGLPLFYMNDFSQLGLMVPQLAPVLAILEKKGFQIIDSTWGKSVQLGGLKELDTVLDLFGAHQLDYELTDLVSCVYQG